MLVYTTEGDREVGERGWRERTKERKEIKDRGEQRVSRRVETRTGERKERIRDFVTQ